MNLAVSFGGSTKPLSLMQYTNFSTLTDVPETKNDLAACME